jgi:hypothetical protein
LNQQNAVNNGNVSEVIMSFLAGDRLGEYSELRLREMGISSFAGGCGVAA